MNQRRLTSTLLAIFTSLLLVAGCTGGDSSDGGDGDGGDTNALQGRLESAQQKLTDAPAIDISLATENLPDGITGLLSAKGRGLQGETVADSAFTGDVEVVTGGSSIDAAVVAVDGEVWAETGLVPGFFNVNPETLGAPDPAVLMGAKGEGLASILEQTEDLVDDGESRDGRDVLTTISGTLPGSVIAGFLPAADPAGSFTVTYRLDDDDTLRDAKITGPFYPDTGDVTYTAILTASDDDSPIETPARAGGE